MGRIGRCKTTLLCSGGWFATEPCMGRGATDGTKYGEGLGPPTRFGCVGTMAGVLEELEELVEGVGFLFELVEAAGPETPSLGP